MNLHDFQTKLQRWQEVSAALAAAKEAEMALRTELFGAAFVAPKEGTNYFDLAGGWRLKGEYKLSRKIDIAQIEPMRVRLASIGVSIDPLINYKPELSITAYRTLTEPTRAVFDELLTITPGAPSMALVPPKGKK